MPSRSATPRSSRPTSSPAGSTGSRRRSPRSRTATRGRRLSLLLADRERILAVTWGDPLSYLVEPDGVVVASEPYDDDPRWVDVPDRHHLEVTRPDGANAARITVTPLETP